jgi:hypothetical protein
MTEDQEQSEEPEGEEADEALFGRIDAAALLAVEGANGGEWAGLGQVIVTFRVMFGRRPEAEEFTESCGLLCEARLIEYRRGGLELTAYGRKLMRRAGTEGSVGRPAKVTDLLQELDESSIAGQGSVPEPSADEVAEVLEELTDDVTRDLERVQASNESRLLGPALVLPVEYGGHFEVLPDFGRADEDDAAADEDDAAADEDDAAADEDDAAAEEGDATRDEDYAPRGVDDTGEQAPGKAR